MAKISEDIDTLLADFKADEIKSAGGNASAATRARKTLMQIIKVCKAGRESIQEAKNAAKSA